MDTPAGDHFDDTPPQHSDASGGGGENGGGDGQPRKKRRRRRGRGRGRGRGPNGEAGEQVAVAAEPGMDGDHDGDDEGDEESDAAPAAAEEEAPPAKAPRGRRQRGGEEEDEEDGEVDAAELPEHTLRGQDIFSERSFADLGLRNSVLKGVTDAGFDKSTTIQAQLIPAVLAGKDVLGQAKTGSGKTAAFGLPLFHMATRSLPFQSLILCPTRELAIQIAAEMSKLGKYTPIKVAAVYGGQAIFQQSKQLERGPEIVVATPGRLMDMLERRQLHLNNVKFVVLDEVDRMLDIGFRDDIKKILRNVKTAHQTIFVSATISPEIEALARTFMREDVEKIVTTSGSLTVSMVEQHYLTVQPWDKRRLLLHLLKHEEPAMTVIFCRTKRTVDDLAKYLNDKGIDAHAMHGDMYQGKRNTVMKRLREGELSVLVASDLAARGLDVEDISHVVNYDLPEDPEIYIHRIGRTARAGRKGVAWALVTPEQGHLLTQIEKLANVEIPKMDYPDFQPGPVPDRVKAEMAAAEKKAAAPTVNRYAASSGGAGRDEAGEVRVKVRGDDFRFPMGLVPAKFPPRMMYGRVKTSRSMKSAPPGEE